MPTYIIKERRYGFWHFLGDAIMVVVTSGFWFIWIFVRENRRKR